MRVGFWWVLAGLGVAGLGCSEAVDSAAVDAVKETSEVSVQALACAPPGAVYKVKDVLPPGAPVPSNALPVPDWLTSDTRGDALWAMPATGACPTQEVPAR